MFYLYEESFVVGGIIDRIVTIASSEWVYPESMPPEDRAIIDSLDIEYALKSLLITGNIFIEKVKNLGNKLSALERFITTEVRISKDKINSQNIIQYRQASDGVLNSIPFPPETVVHIKLSSNKSRYYGDSKIYRARRQIILLGLIDKYYSKMFDNGMLKTTILSDDNSSLTPENMETIKVAMEDLGKGIDNAFSTIIFPTKVTNL